MFYEFKLRHKITETAKNICYLKGEDTVDHSTQTRWLKKICLGCKNLHDQVSLKPRVYSKPLR